MTTIAAHLSVGALRERYASSSNVREARSAGFHQQQEWQAGRFTARGRHFAHRRPAPRRLLEVIGAGRNDIVVVYKVDRLTRSLADFAKLVQLFEAHKVSFVAVNLAAEKEFAQAS